jgi:nitroreductase
MGTMRAMRRLKPDPVPRDLLTELVQAATWAPSASDAQHYQFVVVDNPVLMAQLGELWRDCFETYKGLAGTVVPGPDSERHQRMFDALEYQAEHFDQTPALIAAVHRTASAEGFDLKANFDMARRLGPQRMGRLARAFATGAAGLGEASSIYPACQNLLLAARANGLGATLTIWHLFREADWRKALGVPKGHRVYALIPVGWPVGNFGPVRRRAVDEVVHWNGW